MTNTEIIANEAMMIGFEYDGENLKTFDQWKRSGYMVKKGEKAFIKTALWIKTKGEPTVEWVANDTGEAVEEVTGSKKKFVMKTAFLFHVGQVQKGGR